MIPSVILDFLFPKYCPICQKPVMPKGARVHEACLKNLKLVRPPFRLKCGRRIGNGTDEFCETCKRKSFSFDFGRCVFEYHSSVGNAIKDFKRYGTREYLDFFCESILRLDDFLDGISVQGIVPVPLTKRKLRIRGFNQSELLAEGLSERIGIPVMPILKKTVNTVDQKELGKTERERNLAGAFCISTDKSSLPRSVLLVDDVYTTGSTVNACAEVLKRAGVEKVYFICIGAASSEAIE